MNFFKNIFFRKASLIRSVLPAACLFLALCPLHAGAAERVQEVHDENHIVIVIDPGHGGSNLGTQSGNMIEKKMTMITAKAMLEELEQYDNVSVYMTHTDDKDYRLDTRAEYAAKKQADFLISIHYNASENHTMYGTEVWISCEKPYNAYGFQFGYQHLQAMAEKGLFVRGVKTRIDEKLNNDYYGIIRESVARNVPAVIIEHCYVDEERDADYIADEEGMKEFGRADALSVAKYFGLKSTALGVDYSEDAKNLPYANAEELVAQTLPDKSGPDICMLELTECDYESGKAEFTVSAVDYDTPLIYFEYSLDAGQHWSRLETWPGSNTLTGEYSDTFRLTLQIPNGFKPNVCVRAYNISDLYRTSNQVSFEKAFSGGTSQFSAVVEEFPKEADSEEGNGAEQDTGIVTIPPEHPHKSVGTTTFVPVESEAVETEDQVSLISFLKICLVLVILLFIVVLISQIVNYRRRQKKRRNRVL